MTTEFDAGAFWETRHAELPGDHRNVGNRGLTSEQNLMLISAKAALISHRMGKLGVERGSSVLDAGCGAGVFTSMLAPIGVDLYGCDVSPTAIEAAKQTGCGEFVVAPLTNPGFDRQFDAVLCLDVFFHVVDDAEWKTSVTTLFNAVRPGGNLLIIEYFPGEGAAQARHCRWRSVRHYRDALPNARWTEISNFQYPFENAEKTLLIANRPDWFRFGS